jgi:GNAT superfamily N-acetyltransferase
MRLERVGYGHPDVLRLVERVQAEYVLRYGGPDETPLDPLMFEPPAGSFFVGYDAVDGQREGQTEPVATGAWRRTTIEVFGTTRTAEIKRMYVVPEAQRRGLARRMLAHLEATAVQAGFEAMVLETGDKQPEAIALYESAGYTPVPGYGYYKDSPVSRCFGRDLR